MGEGGMQYAKVEFVKSVYAKAHLPETDLPEIAFAGRSNVGKSSLINRLINRRNLVKVSARPGKTQSLNFFLVDERLHLVDLPGYGFAKVSKKLQDEWQGLVTDYLSTRINLRCVVVVVDIRHAMKAQDRELIDWLRLGERPFLVVYTKRDKLSTNEQSKQAASLDAALGIDRHDRVLFSAKSGLGREDLLAALDAFLMECLHK